MLKDAQGVGMSTPKHGEGKASAPPLSWESAYGPADTQRHDGNGARSFWQEEASVYQPVDWGIGLLNDLTWITTLVT